MNKVVPEGSEATRASLQKSPTEIQVRLKSSKRFQRIVAATTIFAVFCDILGTVIIMPGLAAVCAYAEGGPADMLTAALAGTNGSDAILDEIISPWAFNEPKPPFGFSLAMNVVLSAGLFASAVGSFLAGRVVDSVGCKLPLQVSLFMGLGGYVIIYLAATEWKSYWLFLFGNGMPQPFQPRVPRHR